MSLNTKQWIIAAMGLLFLVSLVLVQWMEVTRKQEETGVRAAHISVPASSSKCVKCHMEETPGIIEHWKGSGHAEKGVGCVDCHRAKEGEADAYMHEGALIAAVVTPLDCSQCHPKEAQQFQASHHSEAGNILASLDNLLAETVEGHRGSFNPHGPTPGMLEIKEVNGMASASLGCKQCHGAKVGILTTDGGSITVDDLKPDANGMPTDTSLLAKIKKNDKGRPMLDPGTWPNTGIGRLNLDGSKGSCTACHSRHDFSPRRARQPENCGKCHMGPDHPQIEIYNESKHGIAYRDQKDEMNLDAKHWVLGKDYTAAPTCASCHMSGNIRNGGEITHDPGERISWTNRPPISKLLDTDKDHKLVTEKDPAKRAGMIEDSWQKKRQRMQMACASCHTSDYINSFYKQYDDLVILYNEKYGKPGQAIMDVLHEQGLLSKPDFDEPAEWEWYLIWHHQGRRARHGASMMGPDYTHWHGMFEVAEAWYQKFIPEVRHVIEEARAAGKTAEAEACSKVVEEIMSRPENAWEKGGDAAASAEIEKAMAERYGKDK
ncbi:hydroxylamine oxidoreductase [bacterium]|nr:hydroxylamine oxidoreductase [bacterium]